MIVVTTTALSTPSSSSSLPSSSSSSSAQLPNIRAAVIVPGFLTGGDEACFRSLAQSLTEQHGIPTYTIPMPAWHWIPCLGGRSMRPILERLDVTVRHVAAGVVPPPASIDYTFADLWTDFWTNPGGIRKVGGAATVDEYPVEIQPRGRFAPCSDPPQGKIALIGHSAGGWISRIYCSNRPYGGKIYGGGGDLVHTLVTLGTPHLHVVESPAFEGVSWVNRETNEKLPPKIRQLAVGGTGFRGSEWGALTQSSYAFCCADGSDGAQYDGDGVTPIQSAIGWRGAEPLVVNNVTHFGWKEVPISRIVAPELYADHARGGHPWYGDDAVLEQWAGFLKV